MIRKLDDWHRLCQNVTYNEVGLDDRATACWTRKGDRFSRGELLRLLRDGAAQWNKWRRSLPDLQWYNVSDEMFWLPGFIIRMPKCDLRNLDFSGYALASVDFTNSNFVKSKFNSVDFKWISGKPIQPRTILNRCSFRSAKFVGTQLSYTDAVACGFSHAELNGATISHSNLSGSKFFKTMLAATFEDTNLADANFNQAYILASQFINVDLGKIRGLNKSHAYPPITLDVRTLLKSGDIPRHLYRSAGMTDKISERAKKLFRTRSKRTRCFISYSSKDEKFVEILKSDLEERGIETWYAPRDLAIGAKTRPELDSAILNVNKLVIVLSRRSILSDWVEQEVEMAFERERHSRKLLLAPIRIDSAVMKSQIGWAAHLRRTRNIGNFSHRKRDVAYFETLERLVSDLQR